MDPISILLGVVFPILLSAGLALALASVSHTAYWIAKVCFCVAALDLAGLTVWWLYTTESVAWKTMVGAALGLIIVATLPEVLRWVDRNEAAVVSERAKRLDQQFADLGPIIEALRQNQRALAASDHTKKLAAALLKSFDNLQRAIQQREKLTGTKDIENRLAVAQHIIDELKVILQNVHTFETSQGKGLIINTAPNRIVPEPVEIGAAGAIGLNPMLPDFFWQRACRRAILAGGGATLPSESEAACGPSNGGSFSQPPALRFQSIAMPSVHRANV